MKKLWVIYYLLINEMKRVLRLSSKTFEAVLSSWRFQRQGHDRDKRNRGQFQLVFRCARENNSANVAPCRRAIYPTHPHLAVRFNEPSCNGRLTMIQRPVKWCLNLSSTHPPFRSCSLSSSLFLSFSRRLWYTRHSILWSPLVRRSRVLISPTNNSKNDTAGGK